MRTFGLIGYPLSHSFSQSYFTKKFRNENVADCEYLNFPISSIRELPSLLQQYPTLEGLNVTIPYKQQVIPFLSSKNEVVAATGACNCIRINTDQQLHGYNTDVTGFEVSLLHQLKPFHTKALILGTGGAAKAVAFVLQKLHITFLYVSRQESTHDKIHYNQLNRAILTEHLLIINATPVGMFPAEKDAPPIDFDAITPRHLLFDLIYNPAMTVFLSEGKKRGASIQNGYAMLEIQAEESWKIWNSVKAQSS